MLKKTDQPSTEGCSSIFPAQKYHAQERDVLFLGSERGSGKMEGGGETILRVPQENLVCVSKSTRPFSTPVEDLSLKGSGNPSTEALHWLLLFLEVSVESA